MKNLFNKIKKEAKKIVAMHNETRKSVINGVKEVFHDPTMAKKVGTVMVITGVGIGGCISIVGLSLIVISNI